MSDKKRKIQTEKKIISKKTKLDHVETEKIRVEVKKKFHHMIDITDHCSGQLFWNYIQIASKSELLYALSELTERNTIYGDDFFIEQLVIDHDFMPHNDLENEWIKLPCVDILANFDESWATEFIKFRLLKDDVKKTQIKTIDRRWKFITEVEYHDSDIADNFHWICDGDEKDDKQILSNFWFFKDMKKEKKMKIEKNKPKKMTKVEKDFNTISSYNSPVIKVKMSNMCLESYPCQHDWVLVTLKNGECFKGEYYNGREIKQLCELLKVKVPEHVKEY